MQKRNLPYRKSIRLKGWDYSNPGLYFVTICTKNRKLFLGEIKNGIMGLSIPGAIAHYYWSKITDQFRSSVVDEYIVMPNHIHGIIGITDNNDTKLVGPPIHGGRGKDKDRGLDGSDAMNRVPTEKDNTTESVGSPVHHDPNNGNLKRAGGATGKHNPMLYQTHLGKIIRWHKGRCTFEIRKRDYPDFAWQLLFYDHIIRNEKELQRIRKYISDNPLRWQLNKEHTDGNEIHEQAVKYMVEGF